jgi:hypothetical protein
MGLTHTTNNTGTPSKCILQNTETKTIVEKARLPKNVLFSENVDMRNSLYLKEIVDCRL